MSDANIPGEQTPDTTPTEALELADQQPVSSAPSAPAPVEHRSHTRTILEVVGGVVAAGLIVVAGAVGFFVGHATGSDHDGARFAQGQDDGQFGPQAGGLAPGQGRQGQQGFGQQGQDPRGIDPDGDNWTGQGRHGMGDGQQGQGLPMMPGQGDGQQGQGLPMMPGQGDGQQGFGDQGQDPRGIDPDGDNWTGQNQQQAPQTQPTVPQG